MGCMGINVSFSKTVPNFTSTVLLIKDVLGRQK